jgi:hypothetical protein
MGVGRDKGSVSTLTGAEEVFRPVEVVDNSYGRTDLRDWMEVTL